MPGDLDQALDAILAPLREQRDAIDKELADLTARREELRQARAKVNRILNVQDGVKPGPQRKSRVATGTNMSGIAPERLDGLEEFIRANFDGREFTSLDIRDNNVPGFTNKSAYTRGLQLLHERGTIRLVRQGPPPGGKGSQLKWWAVAKRG